MAVYQPNIPTGTVNLDVDYQNLQGNFQQLNVAYGVDHVAFSDTSGTPPGGISGLHTVIHLLANSTLAGNPPNNFPIVPPTNIGLTGELFTTQSNDGINSDELLWYQTGGGRLIQMTRNFVPTLAQIGATFLSGGLVMNWGVMAIPNSAHATGTISFTQAFSSACFNVSLTLVSKVGGTSSSDNTIAVRQNSLSTTQFTWDFNGNAGNYTFFFWTALGF